MKSCESLTLRVFLCLKVHVQISVDQHYGANLKKRVFLQNFAANFLLF